jgi:hypothetical protein
MQTVPFSEQTYCSKQLYSGHGWKCGNPFYRTGAGCEMLARESYSDYVEAIAGEKQTNWRRILVRLREAATSMPDEKTSQVVGFSTEIA